MINKEKFVEDIKRKLNVKSFRELASYTDFQDLEKISKKSFFKEVNHNNPNNIYVMCKLNKKEMERGCTKIIRYSITRFCKQTNKEKRENRKIKVKVPRNIKDDQQILIKEAGNQTRQNMQLGDLIIKIIEV